MHTTVWLNGLALRPGGSGVQTYIRELLAALARRDALSLTAAVQADAVGDLPPHVRADTRPVCRGVRRALEGFRSPARVDVVHGLDVDFPVNAKGAGTVATVHDTAVVDVPWAFSANRARAERILLWKAVRTADEIVVPSRFTADRIHALYGRRPHITPLAAARWATTPTSDDVDRVRSTYDLPERFVLQVGTAEPRKLTKLLISAGRQAGVPVILAGMGSDALSAPGVKGLGHIPSSDLAPLYAAATVVSYLSAYEGFGLPPLEAMACGAAVLASDIAPLTEVLADAARFVVNDQDSVAQALRQLVADTDETVDLRERGLHRSQAFSWDLTASKTETIYGMVR